MCKTLPFKIMLGVSLLLAAVFWMLYLIPVQAVRDLPISLPNMIVLIVSAGWGVAFFIHSFASKALHRTTKKFMITFGIIFLAVAVLSAIFAFTDINLMGIIWPIIAIVIIAILLFSSIVVGGKRWDQADNQNVNSQPPRPKTQWEINQERNDPNSQWKD